MELDVTTSPPSIGSVSEAAEYTVRLINRLQSTSSSQLLRGALNVNYPVADEVRGTEVTRHGDNAFVRPAFRPTSLCQDCYLVTPDFELGQDPVRDSDNNALTEDYVSVVPIDGDWTASERTRDFLSYRLTGLR